MKNHLRQAVSKIGQPPGTVAVTTTVAEPPGISLLTYTATSLEERYEQPLAACLEAIDPAAVNWLHVAGLPDSGILEEIGKHFGIHALVLEDLGSTHQRPKIENFANHTFMVIKVIQLDEHSKRLTIGQFGLILGSHFLVTISNQKMTSFDLLLERIRKKRGWIRELGTDYLAYAIIDLIVDHYFLSLTHLDTALENLQIQAVADPQPEMVPIIHGLKQDIMLARKAVWPLKEIVIEIQRGDVPWFSKAVLPFFRDLSDNLNMLIDLMEMYREMATGIMEIYLSSLSNRMNTIMQVLTIIATIFIPVTFVAGIYGMNFKHMPELEWSYGYPLILLLMALAMGLMVYFFYRKKWL
ncbi:MAG: magnesium/cobalt transporter CorA [Deltaproteobacteria bacterium]|nr:magnesium/cobalt transporter CorA [Candidatus Anaeroferrophillus wilburensis]MBN2889712.1 magnesium/cobalt transporter CorA [Deltaproteobacteria bacterium]